MISSTGLNLNSGYSKAKKKSNQSFTSAFPEQSQASFEDNSSVKNRMNKVSEFFSKFFDSANHPLLPAVTLQSIDGSDNRAKYLEIYKAVNAQGQSDLAFLKDQGKLFSADADDGSTCLDNLYKILKDPKAPGLNNVVLLNDTLRSLGNPYSIVQTFGKLDKKTVDDTFNSLRNNQPGNIRIKPEVSQVDYSGTCVAASVEFSLADRRPSEFARYAAGLSSPDMVVKEKFNFSEIDDDYFKALEWLRVFNTPYEANYNGGMINISPDKNAIYRAVQQSNDRKPNTRSTLDVLMQSAFMQLGSEQTYNSIQDKIHSSLNDSDKGLTELQKNFLETIISDEGSGKSSVTYQVVDDNLQLLGYTRSRQDILIDIIDSLKTNQNVVVGITFKDSNDHIEGGHEVTIVGSKWKNGELYLIYNDTDDAKAQPVEELAKTFIPKIHHAGLPKDVIKARKIIQEPQLQEALVGQQSNINLQTQALTMPVLNPHRNSVNNVFKQFEMIV